MQIRDFDQMLVGNPAHDLVRLGLSLAAAGWLWNSVVPLVASHEAGYLEHCRKYALGVNGKNESNSPERK